MTECTHCWILHNIVATSTTDLTSVNRCARYKCFYCITIKLRIETPISTIIVLTTDLYAGPHIYAGPGFYQIILKLLIFAINASAATSYG